MRKLFGLILVLALLCCGLGVYASNTVESTHEYKAVNTVWRTLSGQDITPELVRTVLTAHGEIDIPVVGKVSFSMSDLLNKGVEIPGYGQVSLAKLMGHELSWIDNLKVQVLALGYAYSHEMKLYGGIAAGLMLFLLIGTHHPKRRH